jgi:hypothetical protein
MILKSIKVVDTQGILPFQNNGFDLLGVPPEEISDTSPNVFMSHSPSNAGNLKLGTLMTYHLGLKPLIISFEVKSKNIT